MHAKEFGARALAGVPVPVLAAMNARFPVSIRWTMTLGTQSRWLARRDFVPFMVNVCVAIRWVVAIQAIDVEAVVENDVRVLGQKRILAGRRLNAEVALGAPVREAGFLIVEGVEFAADRRRVEDVVLYDPND
ncbi:MAG TPA: hypothetical protein PK869_17160 [Candidatus Hydrogenedentes bacterium]|nr:hypothetical protein [Candidatus Hydrogenedentota bacterium]